MSIYQKIIIVLIGFSFNSCDKNEFRDIDTIIFGRFYGFCVGEHCIENFKLTKTNVFEDQNDEYRKFDNFNFKMLENESFELVKTIADSIPSRLFDEDNNKVFGCPDCADRGGLVLIISNKNVTKTWVLDQNKTQVPTYLHHLIEIINNKIDLLQ